MTREKRELAIELLKSRGMRMEELAVMTDAEIEDGCEFALEWEGFEIWEAPCDSGEDGQSYSVVEPGRLDEPGYSYPTFATRAEAEGYVRERIA